MADPWFKFYPANWRQDPQLKNCGLLARGLWIEMLALMHQSEERGFLKINGLKVETRQLAIQVGGLLDEVESALAELELNGVFSRNKAGVIYSRKMVKDENRARIGRESGKKGGNPALTSRSSKQRKKLKTLKGEDNPTVNAQEERREKKEERVEEESKASSSTAAAAYERYLEAHPNRVESYEGELDFAGLVQSGVDPNQIIGAAQEYAKTVATWSDEAFVQQSDNFIHPERGKWRQYVQKAKPPPASMDDVMAFWAEKITAGKYVAPSAIKPDMARQMVAANLVSEDQLRQAGVRS